MKKLFVIIALFSYLMGNSYSNGFKFYKKAKIKLRKGNTAEANSLFSQAKVEFESAAKKNSSQAVIKLAEMYCNGWGVTADKVNAKTLLEKAQTLGASINNVDKCLKDLK